MEDTIEELKRKILALHKEAHRIIMNRKDVNATLNFGESKRFTDINNECDELQSKLKLLLLSQSKTKPNVVLIKAPLTPQETKLLGFLKHHYPQCLARKKLVEISGMKPARVNEHLRKFLICGAVVYEATTLGKDGYKLTQQGYDEVNKTSP